jgi:hypothetical protein
MAKTSTLAPLLTDNLVRDWDDVVRRQSAGEVAAPKGEDGSIESFIARLKPIRHDFRGHVQAHSERLPAYAALKVRLADFWQRSPKGARFTGYIWMYATSARDKTLGRLQITFCPNGIVRSEYVSYPKTETMRAYHIEKLSAWLQNPEWFDQFKIGCLSLSAGFALQATIANGIQIESQMQLITSSQWAALNAQGLDIRKYFVIAMDRHRDLLRHMTGDELAELLVGDWEILGGLWPLLQGTGQSLAILPTGKVSPIVEATRRLTRPALNTFSPESTGPRASYVITNAINAVRHHGLIVNALSKELERSGYRVASDQARDLTILNSEGVVEVLFEVKTDSSTSSIYAGVGQLFLHTAGNIPETRRILVLPRKVNDIIGSALHMIGVHVLLYSSEGEHELPTFDSLHNLLRK